MSSQSGFELLRAGHHGSGGEWEQILHHLQSGFIKEDATHRVSLLKSAKEMPVSVLPGTSIRHALTVMMENDYSQLPILEDEKTVRGMVSWRSYGKRFALGQECATVDEAMEPAQILDLDAWLFEAFAAVSKNDAVLIRGKDHTVCGIITAYDVSETFGSLVEPFLLIEEIEKHVRALLREHIGDNELKGVVVAKSSENGTPKIEDLNFGGYVTLLKNADVWDRLNLNLDHTVFLDSMTTVRKIRNDVMHFRPMGIGPRKLTKLRNFAKFLREIRVLSGHGKISMKEAR